MTVQSTAVERRKPRITGYQKRFRKFFRSAKQYILPTVRYGNIYTINTTIIITPTNNTTNTTNIITNTIKLLILILIYKRNNTIAIICLSKVYRTKPNNP